MIAAAALYVLPSLLYRWSHITIVQDQDEATPKPTLTRTSTGLISHKRPVLGTPASSGRSTPIPPSFDAQLPRANLLAVAKRESARKGLYARFFRGPVLAPEILDETQEASFPGLTASIPSSSSSTMPSPTSAGAPQLEVDGETTIFAKAEKPKHLKDKKSRKLDRDEPSSKSERRRRKEFRRVERERGSGTGIKSKKYEAWMQKQAEGSGKPLTVEDDSTEFRSHRKSRKRRRVEDDDPAASRSSKQRTKEERERESTLDADRTKAKPSKEERKKRKEEKEKKRRNATI